jgi:hypothetical protein
MKNTCISPKKSIYIKLEVLAHCFPVRIQFVFERNISCNLDFSTWEQGQVGPNRLIQLIGRNTCISTKEIMYDQS